MTVDNDDSPFGAITAWLKNTFVSKGEYVVNARDHGARGDGVTDDAAAISAANAHAEARGVPLYLAGTFRIDSTVTITAPLDAGGTALHYHGDGVALRVGRDDRVTFSTTYTLPSVYYNTGTVWADNTVGAELVNLNTCKVHHPGRIQGFHYGYRFIGRGTGNVYNEYHLGYSDMNRVAYHITQDEGGWCNENNFYSGRTTLGDAWGAVEDDPGAHYVLLERASTSVGGPNNNRFFGCSFEGPGYSRHRVLGIGARYNTFYGCRWENYGSTYRVRWESHSAFNTIQYGYDAWQITQEADDTSDRNLVIDGIGGQMGARAGGALLVPDRTPTVVTGWGTRTTYQATYDPATGAWSPAPGTWNLRAKVTFYGAKTGAYMVKLRTVDGTTLDAAQTPATGEMTSVAVGAVHIFNPGDAVVVEVTHTTGAELRINPYTGWTTFDAVRVNG